MEEIMNEITPVLVNTVVIILTAVLSFLSKKLIDFVTMKKLELEEKISDDNYKYIYNVAKSVYYFVEQNFKGFSDVIEDKREMFEQQILSRIPYLTKEDIDHFRESIVGEVNETTIKVLEVLDTDSDNDKLE